jgi:hypothetical protein
MARKFRNLIWIDDRSARGHCHANMPTWNLTKALRRKLRGKSEPRETTGMRWRQEFFLSVELRMPAPCHAVYQQCAGNRRRFTDDNDAAVCEIRQKSP